MPIRWPIVSDDALKGTAVVLSKSQLQALPTVVCCCRLAIMMGWTFHHITDKGAARPHEEDSARASSIAIRPFIHPSIHRAI